MTLFQNNSKKTDCDVDIPANVRQILADRQRLAKAPASLFVLDSKETGTITAGFGSISANHEAPDGQTAFRIASCTKSFTAALILVLRDAGLLSLSSPASKYLPVLGSWKLPREDSAHPTIAMFLSMSAGLATDNEWADRQESMSTADFDQLLESGVGFVSEPGTQFEYSNLGYAILGRIAEIVTGQRFTDLVRQRLLTPLGLGSTDFEPTAQMTRFATGYVRTEDSWQPLVQSGPGAFSAIGGLYSTGEDLSAWSHWLRSAFNPTPGAFDHVLSKASRREMQQIHRFIPERMPATGYGYGLFVTHDPQLGQVISHSGGYPGFSSHMRWLVQEPLVAIGFENATYAGVHVAVTDAMVALAESAIGVQQNPTAEIWPQTLVAQQVVHQLLERWDEALIKEHFCENVGLDRSWASRHKEVLALLERSGTLDFEAAQMTSRAPAEVSWIIPGRAHALRCSILMHPLAKPLIQRLTIELESEKALPGE